MKTTIQLDAMLTKEQAAEWLQIPLWQLMKKHQAGIIPGFKVGNKIIRWHPRSVIAKLARNAGNSPQNIAAMFGLELRQFDR
jgi:hypothetical protein